MAKIEEKELISFESGNPYEKQNVIFYSNDKENRDREVGLALLFSVIFIVIALIIAYRNKFGVLGYIAIILGANALGTTLGLAISYLTRKK